MTAWYLDTSAFVKFAHAEQCSTPLRRWVAQREANGDVITSSELLRTEAVGVARRAGDAVVLDVVLQLLSRIAMIRLDRSVFERAGYLGPPALRSLDALHVAAAQELGADLAGIVAYDQRMRDAAREAGIDTVAPRR
jgi:uncharacterized protein